MKTIYTMLYVLALFTMSICKAQIIKTNAGAISGTKSAQGDVLIFKGIPFAAPPVGNLRWKAPQPVPAWQGVKACITFGPSPMQAKPTEFLVYTHEFLIPAEPISEDCLYLNVWTKNLTHKKPVLVWIYGGGFSSGGAGVPIYDGEAMARKGIVFVSINYRVGIFGFFAHPELTQEAPYKASGNYGMLDQIAALQWVKQNIAAFGGDPDNVTIAGQSAGSMSVNTLVASPLAKGLFKKAIAESGSRLISSNGLSMPALQQAQQQGAEQAQKAGFSSLESLRALPAAELMAKLRVNYNIIVDNYLLPQTVAEIYAGNKQNNVPLLTGWNADEGLVFSYQTQEQFIANARKNYGAAADKFLQYYPAATPEEVQTSQVALSRDMTFALSGYKWAQLQSSRNVAPVYVYNFMRRPPATADYVKYKSFHTAEVAYALDNLKFLNRPWQPADEALAKTMSAYWVNFITTGNPNGKGLPEWPKFDAQTNQVMVLDATPTHHVILNKDRLDFMLQLVNKPGQEPR